MGKYKFVDEKGEHLHMLGEKPLTGTSSIGDCIAKPLTWWAASCAVELLGWQNSKTVPADIRLKSAGEMLEKIKSMTGMEYLALLDKSYRAHYENKKKSADKGTDMHAVLEQFVKSEMGKCSWMSDDVYPQVKPFIEWSRKNVRKYIASEFHVFSERLWLGGIGDALCQLNDGTYELLDFKSSKEAYPSQFIQAGLYVLQAEENGIYSASGNSYKKLNFKINSIRIVPFRSSDMMNNADNRRMDLIAIKSVGEKVVDLYRFMGLDK